MAKSFKGFIIELQGPQMFIIIMYELMKIMYMVLVFLHFVFIHCKMSERIKKEVIINNKLYHDSCGNYAARCLDKQRNFCCCCCKFTRSFRSILQKIVAYIDKGLKSLIVKALNGNVSSEGIVSRSPREDKPNKKYKLYIQKSELTYWYMFPIVVQIFSCLCISGLAVWNAYLFKITHSCNDDPSVHCFPLLTNSSNPLNFSIKKASQLTRIEDCEPWLNETVLDMVTFTCFQYVRNSAAALGVIGGLAAVIPFFFSVAIKVSVGLFGCCGCCSENQKCVWCLRITLFLLICVFEWLVFGVSVYLLEKRIDQEDGLISPANTIVTTI